MSASFALLENTRRNNQNHVFVIIKISTTSDLIFWVDNNARNLAEVKSSIEGKIETVEMDVTKIEDFEKLKSKIIKDFGG